MINSRLLSLSKQTNQAIIKVVVYQLLALMANLIMIFIFARVLHLLITDSLSIDFLMLAIPIGTSAFIVKTLTVYQGAKTAFYASTHIKVILREKVFNRLLSLNTAYQKNRSSSEVLQLATEGIDQLEQYFGRYLPQFFYSMISPFILFTIIVFIHWPVAVVLLIGVPLIPVSIMLIQKIAKKLLAKYWTSYTKLGDSFLDNLHGLNTLKVYQADDHYLTMMDEEAETFRKATMRVLIMQLNSISMMNLVAYTGAAIGIIMSLNAFSNGTIALWQTVFIVLVSAEFFLPMRQLGSYFHVAMNGVAASDKLFSLLDEVELKKQEDFSEEFYQLSFDKVSFAYHKNDILSDISLTLPNKGLVALVGESGSGKSTLAGLISKRLIDYKGSLKLNNREYHSLNPEVIHHLVTSLSYQDHLFMGSIQDNLLFANEKATIADMLAVLKQVELLEFIESQEGLQTKIQERASNLSSGQRQRLLLARALLKDTPILILDEATSNIDVESEAIILKMVHKLSKEKLVILITHRMFNVIFADMIYYLENKTIYESGTHKELLANKKGYAQLFLTQQSLESITNKEEAYA